MNMQRLRGAAQAAGLAAGLAMAAAQAAPLSWSGLQALPLPPPGQRIAYGAGPQQFGELRLPDEAVQGKGPYPVYVLLHGGCWQSEYDYVYITRLAAWLTAQGYATWTPEYRRLGNEGGGWPGTFTDVGAAADALREIAKHAPLDLQHVYAAGHSAGGQLALWLASRTQLPADSALHVDDPLKIRGVLGLAAITDLEAYRIGPADSCHASVEPLLGGAPSDVERRYAETSPLRRLPLGVPQWFVQGEQDGIVETASVRRYVDAAHKAGDRAGLVTLPEAGHFDTAVATPLSEAALHEALQQLGSKP